MIVYYTNISGLFNCRLSLKISPSLVQNLLNILHLHFTFYTVLLDRMQMRSRSTVDCGESSHVVGLKLGGRAGGSRDADVEVLFRSDQDG